MTRVAAFDCGTNSLRLLIADVVDGQLTEVLRMTRFVRLGQGVDATGEFAPEALERTFAACEEYAAACTEHAPEAMRFVATSASRDVSNRDEFVAGVRERLGIEPEVITGVEEAELSFRGAVGGVDAPGPHLVMDLGGGSTELVLGDDSVDAAFSMDIGCVRMAERHLRADPPAVADLAGLASDVDAAFDEAAAVVDVSRARTLIGVAGTITTTVAGILGLPEYRREDVHGAAVTREQIRAQADAFTALTGDERRDLGYMHAKRADVIAAGAPIFARLVERIDDDVRAAGGELEIRASETDILDGTALALADSVAGGEAASGNAPA